MEDELNRETPHPEGDDQIDTADTELPSKNTQTRHTSSSHHNSVNGSSKKSKETSKETSKKDLGKESQKSVNEDHEPKKKKKKDIGKETQQVNGGGEEKKKQNKATTNQKPQKTASSSPSTNKSSSGKESDKEKDKGRDEKKKEKHERTSDDEEDEDEETEIDKSVTQKLTPGDGEEEEEDQMEEEEEAVDERRLVVKRTTTQPNNQGELVPYQNTPDERLLPAFVGKLIPLSAVDVRIKHLTDQRTKDNVQLFYNVHTECIVFLTITEGKKYNIEYVYETDNPLTKHLALKNIGVVEKYISEFEALDEDQITVPQAHALYHLKELKKQGQPYLSSLVADHKGFFGKPPARKKNSDIPADIPTSEDGTILVGAKRTMDGRNVARAMKRRKEEFPFIAVPTTTKGKAEFTEVKPHLISLETAKLEQMKRECYTKLLVQKNYIAQIMNTDESECKDIMNKKFK